MYKFKVMRSDKSVIDFGSGTLPDNFFISGILYDGSKLIFGILDMNSYGTPDYNQIHYSVDGGNTFVRATITLNNRLSGISKINSKYVAMDNAGYTFYSDDGATWIAGSRVFNYPPFYPFHLFAVGNGIIATVGTDDNYTDSYIAYSSDGVNWNRTSVFGARFSQSNAGIYFFNGKFYCLSSIYSGGWLGRIWETSNCIDILRTTDLPEFHEDPPKALFASSGSQLLISYNTVRNNPYAEYYSTVDNGDTWVHNKNPAGVYLREFYNNHYFLINDTNVGRSPNGVFTIIPSGNFDINSVPSINTEYIPEQSPDPWVITNIYLYCRKV